MTMKCNLKFRSGLMKRAILSAAWLCLLSLSCVIQTLAQDALPPCWRGASNSTVQVWDFLSTNNPATPEISTNASGGASALMNIGSFGLGYRETRTFSTNVGWWELGQSGNMQVTVPGPAAATNSIKYIWVQMAQYIGGVYSTYSTVSVAGATNITNQTVQVEVSPSLGGVFVVQSLWVKQPSTAPDLITITAPGNSAIIAGLAVDTLTVELPPCPESILVNADPGVCGRESEIWSAPPAVDGCIVLAAADSPPSGSSFPVGTTPVTRTVVYAGNLTNTCSFDITVLDATPPLIGSLGASQNQTVLGTVSVLNCANTVMPGTVDLAIAASDACSLAGPPSLVLSNGAAGEVASYVNESPSGVFNYTWTVTGATAVGEWSAGVAVSDGVNSAATNFTMCVNTAEVALTMLPITFSNSTPVVQFTATPGYSYSLQRSSDLSTNAWATLTNIYLPLVPVPVSIGEYLDADGTTSNAFYRVSFP